MRTIRSVYTCEIVNCIRRQRLAALAIYHRASIYLRYVLRPMPDADVVALAVFVDIVKRCFCASAYVQAKVFPFIILIISMCTLPFRSQAAAPQLLQIVEKEGSGETPCSHTNTRHRHRIECAKWIRNTNAKKHFETWSFLERTSHTESRGTRKKKRSGRKRKENEDRNNTPHFVYFHLCDWRARFDLPHAMASGEGAEGMCRVYKSNKRNIHFALQLQASIWSRARIPTYIPNTLAKECKKKKCGMNEKRFRKE